MIPFEIGREYSTPAELQALFWHAGIQPKRSPEEYSALIAGVKLKPFKSDGPTTYGARYIIAAFYASRAKAFLESFNKRAFKHDVQHWLGDESGLTREQSNQILWHGMASDGFETGASIVHHFVTRYSGVKGAPFGWGFGWRLDR